MSRAKIQAEKQKEKLRKFELEKDLKKELENYDSNNTVKYDSNILKNQTKEALP